MVRHLFRNSNVIPKRRALSELHGVTTQKAVCPSETSGCLRTTRRYDLKGGMSFRNVGLFPNYKALQSKRRYVLPKRWALSELHGVTTQKAVCSSETSGCPELHDVLFIVTAVGTSKPK
jgi:hypothetical protein